MPDLTNTARPPAIVLGLSPTGLYVARELGSCGVPLLGVDRAFASAGASRYFRRSGGVWYEPDPAALLQRLLAYARKLRCKPVLVPTSDYYIEFTVENSAALSPLFAIADGYADAAPALMDKLQFHELCARHGVATPGVWQFDSAHEIAQCDQIPFPCILKPALIHLARPYLRGRKVFVVGDRQELEALWQQLPQASGSWLVQEIIPGEESCITLLAGYSGAAAAETFTARKLRQYPPGFGSASRVISETCDDTRDIGRALVEAMGYRGIYGAEFKRDPRDGKLKIIEINPRPTLWFFLSHAAGKRLVQRAYCDLAGLPSPMQRRQRDGILWQYALKDFASALFYRFGGRGFSFGAPDLSAGGAVNGRCWPVFSATDPAPFFAELWVYLGRIGRRLLWVKS
ncbi:MAG: ATP-grasp domain-containing protein [Halioglobus sp.]|nr:ATP-grasp domain-containing protein [Halioglobus sp.]